MCKSELKSHYSKDMAAELVVEAFLSASIDLLVKRLVSPDVLNCIQRRKLMGEQVKRLKTTLYAVNALLNDAEHKQIKDVAVKKWLDDLKDAIYQSDDFVRRNFDKSCN